LTYGEEVVYLSKIPIADWFVVEAIAREYPRGGRRRMSVATMEMCPYQGMNLLSAELGRSISYHALAGVRAAERPDVNSSYRAPSRAPGVPLGLSALQTSDKC